MRLLLIGLVLTCLMLLTACDSRDTWDVWEIKCVDQYNNVDTRRFEGLVQPGKGRIVYLYPRTGGYIIHSGNTCTYTFLGKGGEVSSGNN